MKKTVKAWALISEEGDLIDTFDLNDKPIPYKPHGTAVTNCTITYHTKKRGRDDGKR